MNDLLKQLGALAFATKLKRLAEALQRDASRIYRALDIEFEGRWFVVIYALSKKSPQAVTEIAEMVGLTHPAINQIAAELSKNKLITSRRDLKDERRRLLALSKKGQMMVAQMEEVWQEIQEVTSELIHHSGTDFLSGLDQIELMIEKRSLYDRFCDRFRNKLLEKVEILTYKPQLKRYFRVLNESWLKDHFKIEDYDRRILNDPNRYIIKMGGQVLFARLDRDIVGTLALTRYSKEIYQLSKMVVSKSARGKQAGRKLLKAALRYAKDNGAQSVILQTSTKLKAAVNLYQSEGFARVDSKDYDLPEYNRKTIVMRLDF